MSSLLITDSYFSNANNSCSFNNPTPIRQHPIASTKTTQLKKLTQSIKAASQPTSEVFNTRITKRVNISITLFLRRPINSKRYLHPVSTINISRYGALVLSNIPLAIGAELEVTRYKVLLLSQDNTKSFVSFAAKAIVRHIEKHTEDNKYSIGLEFLSTSGKWVIPSIS